MPDTFTYDPARRRYLTARGREVPPDRVRREVEVYREAVRDRLKGYAEAYRSGSINRSQFFVSLNEEITKAHSAVAMIAHGGRESMDAAKWGRVGQVVASERSYSRKFHAETLEVDPKDFPAWRAAMYADNVGRTYGNMVVMREAEAGGKVERVLGPSGEHCDTCPAKAGIYDADKVPLLGNDSCGAGCNCYVREVEEVAA